MAEKILTSQVKIEAGSQRDPGQIPEYPAGIVNPDRDYAGNSILCGIPIQANRDIKHRTGIFSL